MNGFTEFPIGFKRWLFNEEVEKIKTDLEKWGQAQGVAPPQVLQIIAQIEREEQAMLANGQLQQLDRLYADSLWAKKRFKELIGSGKKSATTTQDDPQVRKAKGINAVYWQWVLSRMREEGINNFDRSVFDYFKAKQINPLNPPLSYQQAEDASEQYHQQAFANKEKATYKTPAEKGEPIDDMYMVELTKDDQEAEGINMQHCVGTQCFIGDNTRIFSLRDKKNEPHATIRVEKEYEERDPDEYHYRRRRHRSYDYDYNYYTDDDEPNYTEKVTEIKGKQNSAVLTKYAPYIVKWLLKNRKFEIDDLSELPMDAKLFSMISERLDRSEIFVEAARFGFIEIVRNMLGEINKGIWHPITTKALSAAIGNKHDDIVKILIPHVPPNDEHFEQVAANGNDELLDIFFGRVSDNNWSKNQALNSALKGSIKGKHEKLALDMLEKGATNFNDALLTAVARGLNNIIRVLVEKGADNLSKAMPLAAYTNQESTVKLLLQMGATSVNETMEQAAYYGHAGIVKLMLQAGATNIDRAIENAKYTLARLTGDAYKDDRARFEKVIQTLSQWQTSPQGAA